MATALAAVPHAGGALRRSFHPLVLGFFRGTSPPPSVVTRMTRAFILLASMLAACAADGSAVTSSDRAERGAPGGKADIALTGSCVSPAATRCGGKSDGTCYCDAWCASSHDCCSDAASACGVDTNRLEDRTAGMTPLLGADALEVVASLPYPPGNVTISEEGRVFFTFHPEGNKGAVQLAELVDGAAVAWPDERFSEDSHTILSIRIDRFGHLWALDYGLAGLHRPTLTALDLQSGEIVRRVEFPRTAAGFGSLLNDFRISADAQTAYISDQSIVSGDPALVVVDLNREFPIARRRLAGHRSVAASPYDVVVDQRVVQALGLVVPELGVDGIALDATGEWLYYAPLDAGELWRVRTEHLRFERSGMLDDELADHVEHVATTTMTDGMAIDAAGNLYLTDMEHSSINRVAPDGHLEVLARDERLRWPDGLAWHPDGSLYVTASSLHLFLSEIIRSEDDIAAHAPYQILRLRPQDACPSGAECTGTPGD